MRFLISLINTRNKKKKSWSHPTPSFIYLFKHNQEQNSATPAGPGVIETIPFSDK